jgi:hypothetical protein
MAINTITCLLSQQTTQLANSTPQKNKPPSLLLLKHA